MPIIAMTANALEGDRERCIDAGWTTTCASRSSFEELVAAIGRVDLDRRAA